MSHSDQFKRIVDLRPLEICASHRGPREPLLYVSSLEVRDSIIRDLEALLEALEQRDWPAAGRIRRELLEILPEDQHGCLWYACAAAGAPGAAPQVANGYAALAYDFTTWLRRVGTTAKTLGEQDVIWAVVERLRSVTTLALGWGAVAAGRDATGYEHVKTPYNHVVEIAAQTDAMLWTAIFRDGYTLGVTDGANDGILKLTRIAEGKAEIRKSIDKYAQDAGQFELDEEPAKPELAVPEEAKGIVAIPRVGSAESMGGREVVKALGKAVGAELPFVLATEESIARAHGILVDEFPYARDVVRPLLADLRPGEPVYVRPTVLVGEPGGGKSSLAARLFEVLSVPTGFFDAGTSSDHGISGTARRWSSAHPSLPVTVIAQEGVANVGLVVDELEKAGRSKAGSMHDALLSLLERRTSARWRDAYVDHECDLSHVSWIFTANSLKGVPGPLRNRLRPLRMPRPAAEHVPILAGRVLRDILRDRGIGEAWEPPLDGEEIVAISQACGADVSIRDLRRFVEAIIDARHKYSSRN